MNIRGKIIDFSTPKVMGILNITPDSFFDGGKYLGEQEWIEQTRKMLDQGASIIDIGAVSTRPGAGDISAESEIDRLISCISTLRKSFPDTVLSVDTWRSEVAKLALEYGADIINDISGGSFDADMFNIVASFEAAMILMHIQGTPQNMQESPVYDNVLDEVKGFLRTQSDKAKGAGIENIIIDPGFGFGKTLAHNYTLLNHLITFKSLGFPIMAGISRKSMINKVLGTSPENALNGTTAANTIALMNGANILRVHDVKEAIEAIKIVSELLGD